MQTRSGQIRVLEEKLRRATSHNDSASSVRLMNQIAKLVQKNEEDGKTVRRLEKSKQPAIKRLEERYEEAKSKIAALIPAHELAVR